MRAMFAMSGTIQFFNFMFHTLFVLYATTELGLSAGVLGTVLGAGAVGGLIGAACSGTIVRSLGVGPSIVVGCLGFTLPLLLIPLAYGPLPVVIPLLVLGEFLSCIGVMLLDIAAGSLQMALIPDAIRARIMGAYRTLNHGFRPLGALTAGVLGTAISAPHTVDRHGRSGHQRAMACAFTRPAHPRAAREQRAPVRCPDGRCCRAHERVSPSASTPTWPSSGCGFPPTLISRGCCSSTTLVPC